jgi:hypothetical protein
MERRPNRGKHQLEIHKAVALNSANAAPAKTLAINSSSDKSRRSHRERRTPRGPSNSPVV